MVSGASTFGIIDDLTLSYTSSSTYGYNRMTSISEAGNSNKGFLRHQTNTSASYGYDANGNMTTDGHKGRTGNLTYTYNHLNLPVTAVFPLNGNTIEWTYDATGRKLKKVTSDNSGGGFFKGDSTKPQEKSLLATLSEKHYISGIEYNGTAIEAIYNTEGRVVPNGASWTYEYTLKDHLGNARASFRYSSRVQLIQENHYYLPPCGTSYSAWRWRAPGRHRWARRMGISIMGRSWMRILA